MLSPIKSPTSREVRLGNVHSTKEGNDWEESRFLSSSADRLFFCLLGSPLVNPNLPSELDYRRGLQTLLPPHDDIVNPQRHKVRIHFCMHRLRSNLQNDTRTIFAFLASDKHVGCRVSVKRIRPSSSRRRIESRRWCAAGRE